MAAGPLVVHHPAPTEDRPSCPRSSPRPLAMSLPKAGDVLVGKYRVERLIGKGAMGAVFAARHELLQKQVALKLSFWAAQGVDRSRDRSLTAIRAQGARRREGRFRVEKPA